MKLLRKFTQSSRLGYFLFILFYFRNKGLRGLYNIKDPIEREAELVRRLHEYGETWEGTYPTLKEVKKWIQVMICRFVWLVTLQSIIKRV